MSKCGVLDHPCPNMETMTSRMTSWVTNNRLAIQVQYSTFLPLVTHNTFKVSITSKYFWCHLWVNHRQLVWFNMYILHFNSFDQTHGALAYIWGICMSYNLTQEPLTILVFTSQNSRGSDPGVSTSSVPVTHSGGELYKVEIPMTQSMECHHIHFLVFRATRGQLDSSQYLWTYTLYVRCARDAEYTY